MNSSVCINQENFVAAVECVWSGVHVHVPLKLLFLVGREVFKKKKAASLAMSDIRYLAIVFFSYDRK